VLFSVVSEPVYKNSGAPTIEGLPIWNISSLDEEPETKLLEWQVFEVQQADRKGRARHLVGSVGRDYDGQCSSALCISTQRLDAVCLNSTEFTNLSAEGPVTVETVGYACLMPLYPHTGEKSYAKTGK
jgi:hypothetical protein